MTKLADLEHPEYGACAEKWRKWRLTYCGGDEYIDAYLFQFKREKASAWRERRAMTYVPPFAKEAVNEVLNAVFQRLGDVTRAAKRGSYIDSCKGLKGGVDRLGSTMAGFIGEQILPEMLTMSEVGVWVDMPEIIPGETVEQAASKKPYLYCYKVESIKNWRYDSIGKLTGIILQDSDYQLDELTGMPTGAVETTYRMAWIGPDGYVYVRYEMLDGKESKPAVKLNLREIPFVFFCIKHSLLEDVADMQKALLNMESSDVHWCVKANFPIYTEQFDPRPSATQARPAQQAAKVPGFPPFPGSDQALALTTIPAGQAKEAGEGKEVEVNLGTTAGRRYAKETDRPAFIHPSPEPLMASMKKEQQIKEDIRRSVHLSIAMLDPRMASAESKQMDDKGLQNGLLAVGMALEKAERDIAHLWALYEATEEPTVRYPEEWTMQSDSGRRADAEALCKLKDEIPSRTASKEILKLAVSKLIGHRVAPEVLDKIHGEVDKAECLTFKIEDVEKEIQLRIASAETVSKNRGYPADEHEKALEEQAEQLRIVAISQTEGMGAAGDSARGGEGDPTSTKSQDEKKLDANKTGTPQKNTRGKGK